MVLIESVLWTRFLLEGEEVWTVVHANGPERGDVVLVSAEAALTAVVNGLLSMSALERMGLLRLYGDPASVKRLRGFLDLNPSPPRLRNGRHRTELATHRSE